MSNSQTFACSYCGLRCTDIEFTRHRCAIAVDNAKKPGTSSEIWSNWTAAVGQPFTVSLKDIEEMAREVERLTALYGSRPARLEVSADVWTWVEARCRESALSKQPLSNLIPGPVAGLEMRVRADLAPGEWAIVYRSRRA